MAWIICHKSTAWLLPDLFVSLLSGIPQNSVFLIRYLQGSWSHLTFVVIPDLKLYPTFCWLLHTKHHWSFFSEHFQKYWILSFIMNFLKDLWLERIRFILFHSGKVSRNFEICLLGASVELEPEISLEETLARKQNMVIILSEL